VPCSGKDRDKQKHVHTALKGKCTTCHNPHACRAPSPAGRGQRSMLPLPQRTYTAGKWSTFLQKGGCSACHLAHSADEKNLLTKPQVALCQSCHDSGGASFKKAHGNYPVETKTCQNATTPFLFTAEALKVAPITLLSPRLAICATTLLHLRSP
jgi:predicted CXXCH cytochrome family protein